MSPGRCTAAQSHECARVRLPCKTVPGTLTWTSVALADGCHPAPAAPSPRLGPQPPLHHLPRRPPCRRRRLSAARAAPPPGRTTRGRRRAGSGWRDSGRRRSGRGCGLAASGSSATCRASHCMHRTLLQLHVHGQRPASGHGAAPPCMLCHGAVVSILRRRVADAVLTRREQGDVGKFSGGTVDDQR